MKLPALRPLLSVLPMLLALPLASAREGELRREFLYEKAPFPSCHASTIAQLPDGTMVTAWFGGTHEKHPDVGIWFSRLEDGRWTAPREVAHGIQFRKPDGEVHRHPCWNPVLHVEPSGEIHLYYKCGPTPSSWWGMLVVSSDGGQSWSSRGRLPEGIDGPVKNKAVRLPSSELIAPSSTEHDGWRVHFEITSKEMEVPLRVGPIPTKGKISAIQPSILLHQDGRLQAVGRTRQKKVFSTWSSDAGRSWSPLELLELPNPNAGTDAVTLADGRHLLVYNHTPRGRTPLNIAVSRDGLNWEAVHVLEDAPGEYSYPAVIQAADGKVHVTYTWKRQKIRHVVLDPAHFKGAPIVGGRWPQVEK